MAKSQNKRISPKVHATDLERYSALKGIRGYAPANPSYTLIANDARHARVLTARDAIEAAEAAAEAARDEYVAAQWDLHNGMLGSTDQVVAQFGLDSNEAAAMGLKKKSEYKPPKRTPKKA